MLAVLAYCHKDADASVNLLQWMAELDGQQSAHQLLLVASADLPTPQFDAVLAAGRQAFTSVSAVRTNRIDNRPWPMAPNTMFRCAANYVHRHYKSPFWWHEPDCVPLCPGWLSALETEYQREGKPFMGAIAQLPRPHLTGCAIYPADIGHYNVHILSADRLAWDCIHPDKTLRFTHHTDLFHHQWLDPDGSQPTFRTLAKLATLRRGAVVFHRNKDHSLIERLRERRAGQPVPEPGPVPVQETTIPVQAPVQSLPTPAPGPARPIYTYYDPIPGQPEPAELIELWRSLWASQGWSPVVLSEKDAATSTQFQPFLAAIARLPSVNHPLYERACYLRHLAMVATRGGFLTDYDVLPRRFTPADLDAAVGQGRPPLHLFEPTQVPCAIHATTAGYQRLVDLITAYKPRPSDQWQGRPHVSDMEIIRQHRLRHSAHCVEHLCSGQPIRDHAGDGWRTAPMIHFATYSFHKLGLVGTASKAALIRQALASLPPLPAPP